MVIRAIFDLQIQDSCQNDYQDALNDYIPGVIQDRSMILVFMTMLRDKAINEYILECLG